jgi:hypothetical protein
MKKKRRDKSRILPTGCALRAYLGLHSASPSGNGDTNVFDLSKELLGNIAIGFKEYGICFVEQRNDRNISQHDAAKAKNLATVFL